MTGNPVPQLQKLQKAFLVRLPELFRLLKDCRPPKADDRDILQPMQPRALRVRVFKVPENRDQADGCFALHFIATMRSMVRYKGIPSPLVRLFDA